MKKIIFALIIFFTCNIFAQDTNIVKYFPLKTGNIWVYNYQGTSLTKLTITGTTTANGHIYYIFTQSGLSCSCPNGSITPFLTPILPMRIDSVNGNIMMLGSSCQWQINEHLLDSLKARIGDLSHTCSSTRCVDTSAQTVFGILRKVRTMEFNNPYPFDRRYVYGIGLFDPGAQCTFSFNCIYHLKGCVIDGVVYGDTAYPVGVNQVSSEIPSSYSLNQNYPNPFNPSTNIKFSVPERAFVTITIYDVLGEEVTKIVNEEFSPGTYETNWDAANYPSGIYYYQLTVNSEQITKYTDTKKMILIK